MKKDEIINQLDDLHEHLSQAYDIAGSLRDEFTGIGENEEKLKDHCNVIRQRIYDLRELRSNFSRLINQIKK